MTNFNIAPFTIAIEQEAIDDLKVRLQRTRFPDDVRGAGWDYGIDLVFLRELVTYWSTNFDWRIAETALNQSPQYIAEIDSQKVHFVHANGLGNTRVPILLANGWPSNFVELLPLIDLLCDDHDGMSFDVVIPSLQGFGFSSRPEQKGMNLTAMAHLWAKLMSALGYDKFMVHGTDMGAGACLSLLRNHPDRLLGAHYVNVYSQYPRPQDPTPEEQEYFKRVDHWSFAEGAYAMEQGTKPTTLAVGLNDSPAGLAAWVVEKFKTWGDTEGNVTSVFSLDVLCTILSVYWFTETIGSSMRLYKEAFADRELMSPMPVHKVPQAVLVPADCDLPSPKAWGERHLQNLVRWREAGRGGHFPALENPTILANDIREFHQQLMMKRG